MTPMIKQSLRAAIIGTLLYFTLLGFGCMGIRPAIELLNIFSIPSIYVVGPFLNLLPYELDGPAGGMAVIMISAWLEIILLSLIFGLILHRHYMRSAGSTLENNSKKYNSTWILSIILSTIAIIIISYLLPTGWEYYDKPASTIRWYMFYFSIISGVIGMILGIRGKKETNNLIARISFYLGLLYFSILILGVMYVFIELSRAL